MSLRRALGALALLLALASPAFAEAPAASLRPKARPLAATPVPALPPAVLASGHPILYTPPPPPKTARPKPRPALQVQAPRGTAGLAARPKLRPARIAAMPVALPQIVAPAPAGAVLVSSPRPEKRPNGLVRRAAAATVRVTPNAPLMPPPEVQGGAKGAVCGDRAIRGIALAPKTSRVRGCGLANGVKVTEVDGIRLLPAAEIDCATAKALKTWVNRGARPAVGRAGGGLVALQLMGSYSCRGRNGQSGAKISEHGRGKAVDIGALVLADGTVISVLKGWGKGKGGTILKAAHRAACGPFGTVLGPNANAYHKNHFHFDTASYRSGAYCE